MKLHSLSVLLGATTAAVVSVASSIESAQAFTFQVFSGVTSVFLDVPLLQQAANLNLTGTSNTVPPVSGDFLVGFEIAPATNFQFQFDPSGFSPVGGTIEHFGSVTFNNSLTVGNFSIGFDPARRSGNASGFFVRDTITTGAALFDVATPRTVSFANDQLAIVGDLLVSPELAGVLGNSSLQGAIVGAASTNAAAAVPEPATIMGVLAAGGFLAASRRRSSKG